MKAAAPRDRTSRPYHPETNRVRDRIVELTAAANILIRLVGSLASNWSFRTAGRYFEHLFRRYVLGRAVPFFISISLTDRCVCRCAHCHRYGNERPGRPELSTTEVLSVLDQARRMGVYQAIFTGGEPLLRTDLPEIIRYAHRKGFQTQLNTNGWFIDRPAALGLKRAGLNRCAVSLDDADPAVHDGMRGLPGAHRKALEALDILREAGIYTIVNAFVSKRLMASGLDQTIALAKAHRARGFLVLPAVALGRWASAHEQILDASDMEALRRKQDLAFFHLESASARQNCDAFRKIVVSIGAQGDVTPCPFVPFAIGNLRDRPIELIWNRFAKGTNLVLRGACPMNDVERREEFRRTVSGIADGLSKS
jgi:MoaA/NifB/PqqE/SkfB family radical SAM enzyme